MKKLSGLNTAYAECSEKSATQSSLVSACNMFGSRPSWITGELIAETINVLKPYYGADFGDKEAVEALIAIGNLIDFGSQRPAVSWSAAA